MKGRLGSNASGEDLNRNACLSRRPHKSDIRSESYQSPFVTFESESMPLSEVSGREMRHLYRKPVVFHPSIFLKPAYRMPNNELAFRVTICCFYP